jgi:hypothetical protein
LILNSSLKKSGILGCGVDYSAVGYVQIAGFCEHGTEMARKVFTS